jgi:hypothetical protein
MFWLFPMLCAAAAAGPFDQKSMQEALGERQIDRPLVMPKGWMELGLSLDSKWSTAQRNSSGEAIGFEDGARWSYSRLWLDFSNALSSRATLYMRIPFVRASMLPAAGSPVTTVALGDVHSGIIYQRKRDPRRALAWQIDLKSPSGVEWPSSLQGSPASIDGFLTGTGLTNLGFQVHGKASLGDRYSMRLSAGYVFKFAAIVGYVMEIDGFGNGMLDAGDEAQAEWWLGIQLAPGICLETEAKASRRGAYAMGVPGDGVFADKGSEILGPGVFADAGAAVSWEHAENRELRIEASHQVVGSDTSPFAPLGLEEFSPQPGTTAGLQWRLRW